MQLGALLCFSWFPPLNGVKLFIPGELIMDILKSILPEFYHDATEDILQEWWSSGLVAACAAYVVMQRPIRRWFGYGSHYVAHRTGWKRFMFAYNVIMSIYSFATLAILLNEWRTFSLFDIPKDPNDPGIFSRPMFERAVYFFYISKYIEYLDTVFLLIMNKPVSWLQYIHHLGVVPAMHLVWKYHNQHAVFWATFNSFIHTIMYGYYAACVYRWKAPGFFKPLLTSLQLTQFVLGVYFGDKFEAMPEYNVSPYYMIGSIYERYYLYTLILLFSNFYYQTYLSKPKSVPSTKKTE